MITKLKRRFIALAMASLVALMTVIVAGMNIINYNTVIREADDKLAALSSNGGMLPFFDEESFGSEGMGIPWFFDEDDDDDYDDIDASTSEHGLDAFGRGRPFGSRDEAEETRFFSVLLTSDGSVLRSNTDRIFAVDDTSAGEYALEALKQGKKNGFVDEFRYTISSENLFTRITFLDCTSVLTSFRRFLYTSILMSLAGLAVIFGILCYFAGRIVKPVAESYEKQKRFITDAGHEIKTPLAIIKANIDVMRMDLEDIQAASSEAVVCSEDSAAVVGNDDPALSVKADADAATATDQVMGSAAAADHIEESAAADSVAPVNVESIRESSLSLAESLEDINGQVDRLASLTNDLVYLSRMEEAGSAITMTEIPVSDIVSETADSFSALALERKKSLDIQVTPMLSMQGSSKEIEKLVSILVENALKYSVEDDSVHISLKKEGKNIVLEVGNKAAEPLSDEDLAHVFDRFYRGDKSRNSASGGHGIGLSMASAIVAAHGGKIRARSGDGTEFIVTATMPAA